MKIPKTDLSAGVAWLLAAAGLSGDFELRRLHGGRNNRAHLVAIGNSKYLAKSYFSPSSGSRDRLTREYRFCEFCWAHGVDCVPRPLSADAARQLALYEFIDGARLPPEADLREPVEAAIRFVLALNDHRETDEARRLADAAEACFQMEEHLTRVGGRVSALQRLDARTSLERDALRFVENKLARAWRKIKTTIEAKSRPLADRERCVSPSDFGFHNALRAADGGLRFLDFEYAGWDDPAKLVCDFFCQIQHPVAMTHWDPFVEALAEVIEQPDDFRARCRALLPVYRIKWACIVLNEFLPEHRARREFSAATALSDQQLLLQLRKAEALLEIAAGGKSK